MSLCPRKRLDRDPHGAIMTDARDNQAAVRPTRRRRDAVHRVGGGSGRRQHRPADRRRGEGPGLGRGRHSPGPGRRRRHPAGRRRDGAALGGALERSPHDRPADRGRRERERGQRARRHAVVGRVRQSQHRGRRTPAGRRRRREPRTACRRNGSHALHRDGRSRGGTVPDRARGRRRRHRAGERTDRPDVGRRPPAAGGRAGAAGARRGGRRPHRHASAVPRHGAAQHDQPGRGNLLRRRGLHAAPVRRAARRHRLRTPPAQRRRRRRRHRCGRQRRIGAGGHERASPAGGVPARPRRQSQRGRRRLQRTPRGGSARRPFPRQNAAGVGSGPERPPHPQHAGAALDLRVRLHAQGEGRHAVPAGGQVPGAGARPVDRRGGRRPARAHRRRHDGADGGGRPRAQPQHHAPEPADRPGAGQRPVERRRPRAGDGQGRHRRGRRRDTLRETIRAGETALHAAARYGFTSVVDYLVGLGADLDWETEDGTTPRDLLEQHLARLASRD